MKRKKLRLKRGVKKVILYITIIIIVVNIIINIINVLSNNLNNMYNECDQAKGHICSYYEANQYRLTKK